VDERDCHGLLGWYRDELSRSSRKHGYGLSIDRHVSIGLVIFVR
jgi:hypothetical protein